MAQYRPRQSGPCTSCPPRADVEEDRTSYPPRQLNSLWSSAQTTGYLPTAFLPALDTQEESLQELGLARGSRTSWRSRGCPHFTCLLVQEVSGSAEGGRLGCCDLGKSWVTQKESK